MIRVSSADEDRRVAEQSTEVQMAIDVRRLKELLNDTTDGKWAAIDTQLFISKLTGGFDAYNIQSRGDAAFIAYVKNNMQEIIDALDDCLNDEICAELEQDEPEQDKPERRETIDEFLDRMARQRGEL